MHAIRTIGLMLGCVWLGGLVQPAGAQDGTIKIFDSALNELVDVIEPLQLSGRYKFEIRVDTWLGPVAVTICDSNWTAEVRQITLATSPQQITVTGQVTARWCNANFSASLNTTGNATYNATQRTIRLTVNPTSIQPVVNVLGFQVPLPVSINVGPSLSIPPIPVGLGVLSFETSRGAKNVTLAPSNVSLTKRNGFLELQANVDVW